MKVGTRTNKSIRVDLQLIADMIEPGSRVLDVGCGDGALLDYLVTFKDVDGRGIELSSDGVNACVSAGLPVIQGDANTDLFDYPDHAFDYVVLSQTLQAMQAPRATLEQLVRIGRRAIVSLPNFAHWRLGWHIWMAGRMPVSGNLPHQWFETPNIHLCSIRDFVSLCDELGIRIDRSVALDSDSLPLKFSQNLALANLFGDQAVFLLSA